MTSLTRQQVIEEFIGLLVDIDAAIERWQRPGVIRGSQYVIRSSPGLYLRRDTGETGDVYRPVGILRASIWSPEIASVLAHDLRDGAGNRCQRVHYLDALRQERNDLSDLIGRIEARGSAAGAALGA